MCSFICMLQSCFRDKQQTKKNNFTLQWSLLSHKNTFLQLNNVFTRTISPWTNYKREFGARYNGYFSSSTTFLAHAVQRAPKQSTLSLSAARFSIPAVKRAPKQYKLQHHSVSRDCSVQEHVILELPSTAARVTSVRSLLKTRHLYWRRVLLCSARRRPSSARWRARRSLEFST